MALVQSKLVSFPAFRLNGTALVPVPAIGIAPMFDPLGAGSTLIPAGCVLGSLSSRQLRRLNN